MKEYIQILVLSGAGQSKRRAAAPAQVGGELRTGHRVRIQGEQGEFTVLRIDRERYLADLLPDGAVRKIEMGIPLSLLRVVKEPGELDEFKVSA